MKILICHNRYQNPGGEDSVFDAECQLLSQAHHEVATYVRSNDELRGKRLLSSAAMTIWNRGSYVDVQKLIDRFKPDILHCHNTFAVLSPSIYWAARSRHVPVVQTIHNYRLICPNAMLFRSGMPCHRCVGKALAWPGVQFACYRSNRAATTVLALMLWIHRQLGTWSTRIDHYIALTHFARRQLIAGGLDAKRISVIPNFSARAHGQAPRSREYALYAGRLSSEKGVHVLLEAWRQLPDIPLMIAGDGPLAAVVKEAQRHTPSISLLGWQTRNRMEALLRDARFLIVPSLWYEGFPVVVAEALAAGLPVIASRLGGLQEIVELNNAGFLCKPDDAQDLADSVRSAWCTGEDAYARMSAHCIATHNRLYSPAVHLQALLDLYGRLSGHDA